MALFLSQLWQLISEFLFDVVKFPWWWYTGGLWLVCKRAWYGFAGTRQQTALWKFLHYLFTPMYQDYSWSGRALSFVMRLVLVFGKSIKLVCSLVWHMAYVAAWVAVLPVSLFMVLR